MRLGPKIISATAVVLAALGAWLAASLAASMIEERSGAAVEFALMEAGHDWADVYTDGLQVHIGGMAPTEARRFNALHIARKMVDDARIVDGTTVQPSEPLAPPRYSIEILRNDEGITLIGLVPQAMDRDAMLNEIQALAEGNEVTDLLQAAQYPAPDNWESAVHHGLNVLARLPRSKISIASGRVDITAITDSAEEKSRLETQLAAMQRRPSGRGLMVTYDISAPRPVIAPFTLRFVIDEAGARFDACSADTPRARSRILAAAVAAGAEGTVDCTLGLGVPTTEWGEAAVQAISAVAAFGGGSVTFSDADVTLVALETTGQAAFDRIVGELESNLPNVFSLHSIKPEPPEEQEGEGNEPPEFTATRSPEGQVQLRGRLNNAMVRETVESFAKARFGVESVYTATRIDEDLADGWPVRVLAGLRALSELDSGSAVVTETFVTLRGRTGNPDAQAEIARLLGEKLGNSQQFSLDVTYLEELDPIAALPSPEECVEQVNAILSETKITFEPGSSDLSGSAAGVINDIADILKACREVDMEIEIAGHTDSQGREQMNLELSQGRAESVLEALVARRVLTSGIAARGYGETEPVADNDTEEGREANRRIEFRLLGLDLAGETETGDGWEPLEGDGIPEGTDAAEEAADAENTEVTADETEEAEATAAEDATGDADTEAVDATTGAATQAGTETDEDTGEDQ